MFFFYRVFSNFLYPFLILLIYFRKIIKKEDKERFKEKIFISHFNVIRKKNLRLIWFHAASVGELKSILPLIKELNQQNKNLEFLITTTTLSSGNLAKEKLEQYNNISHRYLPVDVNFIINKFLMLWKPDIIFLVDSEIWPNLILNAYDKKIKLGIINARITKKTFSRWMKIPKAARKIFGCFNLVLSSSLETTSFLERLNVKKIINSGNIKLINNMDQKKRININEDYLSQKKFWLAASTHSGEEDFCLKTHIKIKKEIEEVVTIIAPRHINRVSEIQKLCDKLNLKPQILNKNENILNDKEIIIINFYGDLANFYELTPSVFIGKSMLHKLESVGGQSPIEAAQLGCKVYHGPYVYNFSEIFQFLNKNNISEQINNSDQLTKKIVYDLTHLENKNEIFLKLMKDLSDETLKKSIKNINEFIQ